MYLKANKDYYSSKLNNIDKINLTRFKKTKIIIIFNQLNIIK